MLLFVALVVLGFISDTLNKSENCAKHFEIIGTETEGVCTFCSCSYCAWDRAHNVPRGGEGDKQDQQIQHALP